MLGSESMLNVHTMALSEPHFIFLCLIGLLFLTKYLEKGGRGVPPRRSRCFRPRISNAVHGGRPQRDASGRDSRLHQAPEVVQALDEVRALGAIPIFTNDCGAVYFQAGRYAYLFPSEAGTNGPAALAKALGTAPACFVYYWAPPHLAAAEGNRSRDLFENGLIDTLGLRILAKTETITVLWRPASN
jgi:hypothetical protein